MVQCIVTGVPRADPDQTGIGWDGTASRSAATTVTTAISSGMKMKRMAQATRKERGPPSDGPKAEGGSLRGKS
jgi:hypothetical protein